MGREIQCDVRHEGRSANVKALLETEAVILRGEIKATIPFARLSRVEAVDGKLYLDETVLDLGPQAAQWADKILNPPTLLDKLGIKAGMRVALLGFEDSSFMQGFPYETALSGECDAVLFQANAVEDLDCLPKIGESIGKGSMLWIVYPKGRKEITEAQVFAHGKGIGLVDVKVCKFSETLTGLKFLHRRT
jgi:hypothetical protein